MPTLCSPSNVESKTIVGLTSSIGGHAASPDQLKWGAPKRDLLQVLTGQAEFGIVRPGQLADIPAIDGGPLAGLDDSANASLVIQDGDILTDNLNSCHAGDET